MDFYDFESLLLAVDKVKRFRYNQIYTAYIFTVKILDS